MKLHQTLVNKLVKTYEVNSGYREEYKLIEALKQLDLTVYTQSDGTQVLVDTLEYNIQMSAALLQQENKSAQTLQNMAREAKKYNK